MKLLTIFMFLLACGEQPSKLASFQTRTEQGYLYLLTHTARIDGAKQVDDSKLIKREQLSNHGQCFYKVTSDKKIRLHRATELHNALTTDTEIVSPSYIPLDHVWKMFKKERDLQELYTSDRHWIVPSIGVMAAAMPIGLVDSFLHRANGEIVENSQKEVMQKINKIPKEKLSLRQKTYQALHLTAKVEHATDEYARSLVSYGKKNPIRRINSKLIDSKIAKKLAHITKKHCRGKAAAVCTLVYLAAFNSMFVVGVPIGGDRIANKIARFMNGEEEENAIHEILGNRNALGATHITSSKTMTALEKIANYTPPSPTMECPKPQDLSL